MVLSSQASHQDKMLIQVLASLAHSWQENFSSLRIKKTIQYLNIDPSFIHLELIFSMALSDMRSHGYSRRILLVAVSMMAFEMLSEYLRDLARMLSN